MRKTGFGFSIGSPRLKYLIRIQTHPIQSFSPNITGVPLLANRVHFFLLISKKITGSDPVMASAFIMKSTNTTSCMSLIHPLRIQEKSRSKSMQLLKMNQATYGLRLMLDYSNTISPVVPACKYKIQLYLKVSLQFIQIVKNYGCGYMITSFVWMQPVRVLLKKFPLLQGSFLLKKETMIIYGLDYGPEV